MTVGGGGHVLQVYVPQNTTQFSMFHIFCHMHMSWPIIVFFCIVFHCIFSHCAVLQLDLVHSSIF